MNTFSTLRALTLAGPLLCVIGAPGEAVAQYGIRVDNFLVATHMDEGTGRDRWFAIVFPHGQTREGALMWSCGDDPTGHVAAVRLADAGANGAVRKAAWSVDGDSAGTVLLRGTDGSRTWLVDDGDVAAFTRRVRAARQMTLRVPGAAEGAAGAGYRYALGGADSALSSLHCAPDAAVEGTPSGRETLLALASWPFLRPDGMLDRDPFPHGWMPRLANPDTVVAQLQRTYPIVLRDAGVTGDVVLRVRIMADGRVDLASVRVESSSHDLFTTAAMTVLAAMQFHPARRHGKFADIWADLPIQFRLSN